MTKAILSAVVLLAMVISFGAGCDWDHDHWRHDDYYRTSSRYGDQYYADHDWDRVHRDRDWYHDRDDD